MFEKEKVSEKEAREFAEKIGAIYHSTSAKESIGIDALFKDVGIKIIESNDKTATFDETLVTKLSSIDMGKKKKCC